MKAFVHTSAILAKSRVARVRPHCGRRALRSVLDLGSPFQRFLEIRLRLGAVSSRDAGSWRIDRKSPSGGTGRRKREFKSKAPCSQSLPVAKPRSTTSVGDCERARTSKEEDQTPGAREREHPTRWMSSTVQSRERNWCTGTTCRHRTFLAHSFESPALCLRWLPSMPRGRRFLALRARKR